MKKPTQLLLVSLLVAHCLLAQTGNVGVGTTTPTSKLQVSGSIAAGYRQVSTSATLDVNDYTLEYGGTTAATLTLPNATGCAGRIYVIKNMTTAAISPVLTINTVSSQTIDGKANWIIDSKNEIVTLISNGTNWAVQAQQIPNAKSDSTGGSWIEGGNTDPSTATRKLGTLSNNDLPMITNGVERMRITKTGNIGVGTASPSAKFEIASGTANTSGLKFTNLNNSSPTTASTAILGVDASGNVVVSSLSATGATGPTGAAGTNGATGATGATGLLSVGSAAGNTPYWNGSSWVVNTSNIYNNGGNIGIGTTGPSYKLDVTGTGRYTGALTIGAYTLPNTDGTSNQVLTTNGAGAPSWQSLASINVTGWSLIGNSGTTPGTNYIGTSDNQSLVFKANGVQSGKIDLPYNNISLGYQSAASITNATNCTFMGYQAGYANTTGGSNTGLGSNALNSNTTGTNNTAVGMAAMINNTTGANNTSMGTSALRRNTTGVANVAIGSSALTMATTAGSNTAVGSYSQQSTTTGSSNTAVGYSSLGTNTTGTGNTTTGAGSLQNSTTGSNNTANGNGALQLCTTASNNSAVGAYTLQNVTTGGNNTAIGYGAAVNTTTGGYNTTLGNSAGVTITTGSNNTFLGTNADATATGLTNATAIGYNAKVATNNTLILGGMGANTVNVAIGTDTFDAINPEKLLVNTGATTSDNAIVATGTINHWLQTNIQNKSNGAQASSDVVATADNGTDTSNFMDLGINSSGYVSSTSNPIETGKANDGYLMSYGNDFYIVNAKSNKDLLFLTGGSSATNERMRVTSSGKIGIGTATPTSNLEIASGVANTSGLKFTNLNSSSPKNSSAASLGVDASGNVVVSNASGTAFTGCTSSTVGTIGLVPSPPAGSQNMFLTGAGGWGTSFPLITANGTYSSTTEVRDMNTFVTRGNGFYITDVNAPLTNPIPNEGAWFEFSQTANSNGYFGQTSLNDHNFYYRGGVLAGLTSSVWQKMFSIPATSQSKFTTDATNNLTLNVVDNAALTLSTYNTDRMKIDSTGKVRIGSSTTTFDAINPERLLVNLGTTTTDNAIVATGSYNHWLQTNIQNKSNGSQASSDIVATADNGTDTSNFMDMGINSSGYVASSNNPIETGKANDGYLMSYGNDFYIVNARSNKDMLFLTGGSSATNERMRIASSGNIGIGTATPGNLLEINTGVGGTSGLRLKQIPTGAILFSGNNGDVSQNNTNLYFDATNYRLSVAGGTTPNSTLQVGGSVGVGITTKTASYTAGASDYTILCNTAAGAFNISLPNPAGCTGRIYVIKKISNDANAVTLITYFGSSTIDGATTYSLSSYNSYVQITTDGTKWYVIAK